MFCEFVGSLLAHGLKIVRSSERHGKTRRRRSGRVAPRYVRRCVAVTVGQNLSSDDNKAKVTPKARALPPHATGAGVQGQPRLEQLTTRRPRKKIRASGVDRRVALKSTAQPRAACTSTSTEHTAGIAYAREADVEEVLEIIDSCELKGQPGSCT